MKNCKMGSLDETFALGRKTCKFRISNYFKDSLSSQNESKVSNPITWLGML